ncbi:MAG: N-acetylmuramoyl-L-alanine amidase, partial [Candidatus Omnitrophica bacterium]|nr:N-acetylmuramoyl-L-alanine amidase [Candidatus Omnitrophota bacterium]
PCTVVRPKGEFPLTSIKKVVIDAGHGGNDPGAIGRTGLREKDVNLDIAKRLSKLLRDEGVEVVMTRSSDVFVSLGRRCSIANNANADLFISIHANANPVRSLNGLEIYYITPKISDSKRAISSAGEDQLYFDNASFSGKSLNTKAILWDMIYTYNRAESIGLANQICKSVGHASNVRIIGAKAANFQVLRCTLMPSILIETGFLSNREEETLLKNSFYRQQITDAIMQGIRQYARDNVSPEVF